MASMIWKAQGSMMCMLQQMFPDWFAQQGGYRISLKQRLWRSVQCKYGGMMETRKYTTEHVNMIWPHLAGCLIKKFASRNILGELGAVKCEYLLVNQSIARKMHIQAWYINFNITRKTCAKWWLGPVLPQGRVSIRQNSHEYSKRYMHTIIHLSGYWQDNTMK